MRDEKSVASRLALRVAVLARLLSMRKNDVVERILLVRDNGESLLVTVERENMRLAIECGFGPPAQPQPQEDPGFEQSAPPADEPADDTAVTPQADPELEPVAEPEASSIGMDAEAAEETKGEEQEDEENVKKQVVVVEEGTLEVSPPEPQPQPEPEPQPEGKIASAHDLRMLQESDEIVLLLLQAVSGLVGPDVHAHPCYAEGSLWREYYCTAM